ncbi:conserved protein, unknown function [Plasmodium yoelii]|uniref:F-box protein FBXO1 n=3 Tax=Plasmodium yoelii TaxID=5861 RepID=A0AAF0B6S6_PLAYO|nr:conserved protein, unknown function [Plasmodium yoelii]WBY58590.1 F-box protein FBXO1 [Plasmodium yoelii yoelii]CDU18891.1 conserved Plasmodium protein, unknown function [Plasmodium yoelii]VTZ79476.1 conserved protein, unknown function [Plasmodium yoelii]|eukprot:XP_728039.2 conserved protein, unknown function [Plasmodium yoelii]
MGNKISDNKQRQLILYKDIKNRIKIKNNIGVKDNIYISKLTENDLLHLNNDIFESYNTIHLKEQISEKNKIINKKDETVETTVKINFIKKKKGKISNSKHNENIVCDKNEKKEFELDYSGFYGVEKLTDNDEIDYINYIKKKKKKPLSYENKGRQNGEKNNNFKYKERKKNTLLKKKKTDYTKSCIETDNSILNNTTENNEDKTNLNKIQNNEIYENCNKKTELKHVKINMNKQGKNDFSLYKYENDNIIEKKKNKKKNTINYIKCEINKDDTTNENTCIKEKNKLNSKFLNILKEKKILQNILSFLACNDLLEFQRTCSIIYICVSDFLDYICLNIYSKFKKEYIPYFKPVNFFYKYEYLYTDKPSFRLDCILIAKVEKRCTGYNNRFGYKHKYIYDKKKGTYCIYFNFNVLKSNASKTIEIHKDISYNNGDDINISHIINKDACPNDYICIPINLYNFLGIVNYNSIYFFPNKLSKHLTYNNQFDDQLWYNSNEYNSLIKDKNIIPSESFLPHLKHVQTIYSGMDITIMKSTYKAVEPGRLGKRSYLLWGNYFIIKNKYDPIYIFLKREGLQHDYLYHNFYLRVGDHIVFYLIKGGNNI